MQLKFFPSKTEKPQKHTQILSFVWPSNCQPTAQFFNQLKMFRMAYIHSPTDRTILCTLYVPLENVCRSCKNAIKQKMSKKSEAGKLRNAEQKWARKKV